ncbi:MAG: hypothetical protein ACREOH_06230, partial [Candidatus Entotheonellia bacterium]
MEQIALGQRKVKGQTMLAITWQQLCRSKTGLAGLAVIVTLLVVAVLADVAAPYS